MCEYLLIYALSRHNALKQSYCTGSVANTKHPVKLYEPISLVTASSKAMRIDGMGVDRIISQSQVRVDPRYLIGSSFVGIRKRLDPKSIMRRNANLRSHQATAVSSCIVEHWCNKLLDSPTVLESGSHS